MARSSSLAFVVVVVVWGVETDEQGCAEDARAVPLTVNALVYKPATHQLSKCTVTRLGCGWCCHCVRVVLPASRSQFAGL